MEEMDTHLHLIKNILDLSQWEGDELIQFNKRTEIRGFHLTLLIHYHG